MKIARGRELLTPEQRQAFMQIPEDEWILGTYFTFSKRDLEIVNKRRREENRLGFAVQLAVLRYPGWPYTHIKSIPDSVIQYISKQIGVSPSSLDHYPQRENTLWDHLKEIRSEYDFVTFTLSEYRMTFKYLHQLALENGDAIHLLHECIDFLRKNKIILPAITTLERMVWEARAMAEKKLFNTVSKSLTNEQKEKLEGIITSQHPSESNKTILGWLKEPPGHPSPETFLKIIERLEYIRGMDLETVQISHLHRNRLLQLSRLGSRYEPYAFRDFQENKRYSILTIYLLQLTQELTDKAFEIHDRQILSLLSKGRKAQEEIQKQNGKKLNEKVIHFTNIGQALIKAREEKLDVFKVLESVIEWNTFVSSVEEAQELARPADYDYLDLLQKRFYSLRKYTPTLLRVLEFHSTKANEPLLQAVEIIRGMNESGKRKVPDDSPVDFISKRWKRHLYEDDGTTINRHYYEMAVLTELREHVRAGDVSIVGSRQYRDFEEYLFSEDTWNQSKGNTRLSVSLSFEDYITERTSSFNERLKWLAANSNKLDGVSLEKGKLSLARLEKDVPEEAKKFSASLYQMLPRIKLTDLLMDVAHITGFHEQFTHASNNRKPDKEETIIIMAALLGMGMNIGLSKMAEATPGLTYKQLANVSQWRMYEDAMNKAQAILVNFHHKLQLPFYWGDGTTSSSDGMRMQLGVSSLHADANPHYGTGKGATIYRFTSDQFSSYYTKIIHTNSRDAIHVLDGLLHHETDLNIEEHYTDTAGYTDQIFGLTHLLGFKFAPRIRDLSDSKLFTIDKASEYPKLEAILRGQINTKVIKENYEDVLRLAHSIREGTVSASLIMGKLGSYSRQNSLATALREMGRIEKTIFILNYISDESLRRKIQRGLNKGEAMNGLARAIFFGKQGELRERTIQHQLQRASALNIIINAISIWNTLHLTTAVEYKKRTGSFNEDLLHHMSPLGWEHINLLGEYHFNSEKVVSLNSLRPLKLS
ncbi:TPA: Tn3 family transposase [Enterococcus faecium]|uniref:Transposase for transposon Tn1546 n=63 Tax=Bacteria TaxID=2 RepID=TNP6_ENTFC|nr:MULTISPECIES: Tn3 family transposase [Bacilli]Q06238.1 RecName: Full=Transposase for transposon Tn1546 [Enterococcus faecium]MBU5560563.1 Tn3 family transposase [Enterococcus sp. S115_ASV_20]MBU5578289.1 Tn3 family transposase [Enterococcus sp. S131_ASV_20]BBU48091.1 putative transposase protein [Enterococcus saigonensis]HJG11734.1 Tn3 family transposase [Bacteroides xylanisolvens]AAA65951.1 transposase [Enterococcus faecium]